MFVIADGAATSQLRAVHVLQSGILDPLWPAGGALVSDHTYQLRRYYGADRDGAGGLFIVWSEWMNAEEGEVRAQHVLPTGMGDANWPIDGRLVPVRRGTYWIPTWRQMDVAART